MPSVKVFDESADITKQYKNLRKNKHVKPFLKPFASSSPDSPSATFKILLNEPFQKFETLNLGDSNFLFKTTSGENYGYMRPQIVLLYLV